MTMTPRKVYLDNSATTKVDSKVLEAMLPYFSEEYGNPNSLHAWGREARKGVDNARSQVAQLIGAEPKLTTWQSKVRHGHLKIKANTSSQARSSTMLFWIQ